jgi:thymidine kinase
MYLKLCIGPMFSGKTTNLIEEYNTIINKYSQTPFLISHKLDLQRQPPKQTKIIESNVKFIRSHDGICVPATLVHSLIELEYHPEFESSKFILIDEGQFFDDLVFFVKKHIKTKNIFVWGLSGDFKQEKIGQIVDLIPFCDSLIHLTSNCKLCGNIAPFSKRLCQESCQESQQILIGGDSSYVPVCRSCI